MPVTRPKIAPPPVQCRTRVGTGGAMLAGLDLRTHAGRRYREICADMVAHLGGEATAPQEALIRRAAALSIWCEAQESAQASGGELDIERYNGATNTLRRLLSDLGLERRARDVTPDLHQFLASRAGQERSVEPVGEAGAQEAGR